ncbi:TniQ family protein [Pseudomonas frederiksbergensis]|uniref:TniQ family protein n=1 Tax=Pseudomonas frederiksbergensis TaxID=104087 RepID=UPI0008FAF634|nr:TniQ family protein [Pseudomonas frederiksbergensis]
MKKMIFVPRPFPLESPTSLLMRAAQKNGYLNVEAMCRRLAIEGNLHWVAMRTHQHAIFALLCQEAPPLAQALRQTFYRQPQKKLSIAAKVYINSKAVPGDIFRVDFCPCPQCLADGYTRPAQDLKVVDICPYHNTPLMMVCPQCGVHNKWYKLKGFQCACGFDYKTAYILSSQPRCRVMINTSFGHESARHILNKMYKEDLLRTAIFPKLPGTEEQKTSITAQIKEVLTRELRNYSNLPLSVFEAPWLQVKDQYYREFSLKFLRQNHHQDKICKKGKAGDCCSHIALRFDELAHAIDSTTKARQLIHNEQFQTFRDAPSNIIFYRANNLCSIINAKLDKRQNHTNKADPGSYSTLNQAAIKLHTNTTALYEVIKRGLIPEIIVGDRAYFIPNDVLKVFSQTYVFSTELAQVCDVSTRMITPLSNKLNLILAFPRLTPFFPSIYLRSSIPKNLMKAVESFRRHRMPRVHLGLKTLRELSIKIELDITTTRFILKHQYGCVNPNWWISDSVAKALTIWRHNNLTIKEISTLAGVSHLLIDTRFIHTGLIKPTKIYRTNFINPEDTTFIINHLEKYLSIIQAARLFSVSENKIRALATSGTLKTLTLEHKNGHRQILIERTQENSRTLRDL